MRTKSLNTQLRQKGLEMVPEQVIDPAFGPVYTFQSLKPGMSNNDIAYRLYYAGEASKWSATRRKAIDKAMSRVKQQEEADEREQTVSTSGSE